MHLLCSQPKYKQDITESRVCYQISGICRKCVFLESCFLDIRGLPRTFNVWKKTFLMQERFEFNGKIYCVKLLICFFFLGSVRIFSEFLIVCVSVTRFVDFRIFWQPGSISIVLNCHGLMLFESNKYLLGVGPLNIKLQRWVNAIFLVFSFFVKWLELEKPL